MTLRVKLEIVPFGDESRTREIGRLDIFNQGEVPRTDGLYNYGVIELTPTRGWLWSDSVVHERQKGAWELVRNVLESFDILGP